MGRIGGALAVVLTVALVGCGDSGPTTHPVSGKVTIKGEPADGVQITFHPVNAEQQMASGNVKADGTYELFTGNQGKQGAEAGKYKVVLVDNKSGEDYMNAGPADQGGDSSTSQTPDTSTGRVPDAYSSADTSPKEVEVTSGDNTINIEIE